MKGSLYTALLVLILLFLGPLGGLILAGRRKPASVVRRLTFAAFAQLPIAWGVGGFVALMGECFPQPCPPIPLKENLQWWGGVTVFGLVVGAAAGAILVGLSALYHQMRPPQPDRTTTSAT